MRITSTPKRGLTLIELSIVIIFGLVLAAAGSLLLQQQLTTISLFRQQNFILREAPTINRSLTSLLDRADAIRIHTSFDDAVDDLNPTLTGGSTLVAAYRDVVTNTTSFGIIHFDQTNLADTQLNYYLVTPGTPPQLNTPSWQIARDLQNVNIDLVNGIFQITLTGPAGEMITYSISPNQ